jgi:hypothetical protein
MKHSERCTGPTPAEWRIQAPRIVKSAAQDPVGTCYQKHGAAEAAPAWISRLAIEDRCDSPLEPG